MGFSVRERSLHIRMWQKIFYWSLVYGITLSVIVGGVIGSVVLMRQFRLGSYKFIAIFLTLVLVSNLIAKFYLRASHLLHKRLTR
jgi:hypothetical protein